MPQGHHFLVDSIPRALIASLLQIYIERSPPVSWSCDKPCMVRGSCPMPPTSIWCRWQREPWVGDSGGAWHEGVTGEGTSQGWPDGSATGARNSPQLLRVPEPASHRMSPGARNRCPEVAACSTVPLSPSPSPAPGPGAPRCGPVLPRGSGHPLGHQAAVDPALQMASHVDAAGAETDPRGLHPPRGSSGVSAIPHCMVQGAGDQHPAPALLPGGQPGPLPCPDSTRHPAGRKLPVVAAFTHCTARERARSVQPTGSRSCSAEPHATG